MMRNFHTVTLGILAMAGLCHGADYTVHVVEPAVTNHMILPKGPLPPVCKPGRGLRVFACRGEYEPASFVISTPQPLKAVAIEVGKIMGPGGAWPAEAIDIRFVKEIFRGAVANGAMKMPVLLVHDDGVLTVVPIPNDAHDWLYNQARTPFRDAARYVPVDIDGRRQFWVTVHVPAHAAAGKYETKLRIAPAGAEATELSLTIEVYPFDLLEPMKEYSIYYPVRLVDEGTPDWRQHKWTHTALITPRQYLAECRNMVAHGLTNPNIYNGPGKDKDGNLDFSLLDRIIDLREQAGMRPKVLYIVDSPLPFHDRPLTADEREKIRRYVPQMNAWARGRGYDHAYWMPFDEWPAPRLRAARESFEEINRAGGRLFAAVSHGFVEPAGKLLHRAIVDADARGRLARYAKKHYTADNTLANMHKIAEAGHFRDLLKDDYQRTINAVHALGHKVFTYMNPMAGQSFPDLKRRNEGLGMWRVGFDGTMNWAYTHYDADKTGKYQRPQFAKVYRTDGGVLDSLGWEGFREGVDDVRYLTTLLATLGNASGNHAGEGLIAESYGWLDKIDVAGGDLDTIRREMARRIIALQRLGN